MWLMDSDMVRNIYCFLITCLTLNFSEKNKIKIKYSNMSVLQEPTERVRRGIALHKLIRLLTW